jgi:hypothetical protein
MLYHRFRIFKNHRQFLQIRDIKFTNIPHKNKINGLRDQ